MNFTLPEARRERMEQLLEYLGDTSRYSEYYDGNRAEDFKKCFDIESEWCWKYADLMLRGMEKRELEYAEGHHIVPRSFYGKRRCHTSDDGNLTVLTYGEHLWAHYCLVWCATGKMQGKMPRAFITMYNIGMSGRRPIMPSEAELLDAIPDMELRRIQAMEPMWAKVEADGRTHFYEDPKQYKKEYYEANREKLAEWRKAYYEANREKIAEKNKIYWETNREKLDEYHKAYREANREKLAEQRKAYYEANKDMIYEYQKAYNDANREKIAERDKAYRETNREKVAAQRKAYYDANREKIAAQRKAYYDANREKIAERDKSYREANREKILERKKAQYEANREKIAEKVKAYYDANREKIAEYHKAYRETNREKITAQRKAYREANREKIAEEQKARRESKKAAGYRRRKNPLTGKEEWVFVGLPVQEVAA